MFYPILSAIAPSISSAIGGIFHGDAVNSVKTTVGIDLDNETKDQIQTKLSNLTPEQIIELRKEDNSFSINKSIQTNNGLEILKDHMHDVMQMQNPEINSMRKEHMRCNMFLLFFIIAFSFYMYMKGEVSGTEGILIGTVLNAILGQNRSIGDFLRGSTGKIYNLLKKDNHSPLK